MKTPVIVLFIFACNSVFAKPKIIGGEEAEPHSIPYQVYLKFDIGSQSYQCGGSLVSENYVLTAAHCIVLGNATEVLVVLGAHNNNEAEDTQLVLTATEFKVHEGFDGVNVPNDIALIKLPEAVKFTEAIQPVRLPSSDAANTYEGDIARVSGWGYTTVMDFLVSDVLMYLDMEVISNDKCLEFWKDIDDSIICTFEEDGSEPCNGDSGGPLADDGVLIGITSFNYFFCLPGYPVGFTRVSSFLDWIAVNSDVKIE